MKNVNASGSSPLHFVLLIIVLGIITGVGFYVYNSQEQIDTALDNANQSQTQVVKNNKSAPTDTPNSTEATLDNGAISYQLSADEWKTTTGGYFSAESGRCGQTVTSSVKCTDHVTIIPANETMSNADQFHVNISVFDKPNSKSPYNWYTEDVYQGIDGMIVEEKTLTVNGVTGYMGKSDYSTDAGKELRFAYVLSNDTKGVLISTTLFSGDHYSYKNTTDYTNLQSSVEKIVNSIRFN